MEPMTVKELIRELSRLDPDMHVFVTDEEKSISLDRVTASSADNGCFLELDGEVFA